MKLIKERMKKKNGELDPAKNFHWPRKNQSFIPGIMFFQNSIE